MIFTNLNELFQQIVLGKLMEVHRNLQLLNFYNQHGLTEKVHLKVYQLNM